MKMKTLFAVTLILALGVASAAFAAEVTLTGKVACAKCTLKNAGAKECADVLVVPGEKGAAATQYYVVKNDVAKGFGHQCSGEKAATVTGAVAEKDGKMWITPSKMVTPKG